MGVKNSTSDLLIANCDEFIYYDDLIRVVKRRKPAKKKAGGRKDGEDRTSQEASWTTRAEKGVRAGAGNDRRTVLGTLR